MEGGHFKSGLALPLPLTSFMISGRLDLSEHVSLLVRNATCLR